MMYTFVCKYGPFKQRSQSQQPPSSGDAGNQTHLDNKESRRQNETAVKELEHLNHKIEKMLAKMDKDDCDEDVQCSPDDLCAVCFSAKATMQTLPCGHRVICRKCFIKTIRSAIANRALPLKCIVCRTGVLKLGPPGPSGSSTGQICHRSGRHYSGGATVKQPTASGSSSAAATPTRAIAPGGRRRTSSNHPPYSRTSYSEFASSTVEEWQHQTTKPHGGGRPHVGGAVKDQTSSSVDYQRNDYNFRCATSVRDANGNFCDDDGFSKHVVVGSDHSPTRRRRHSRGHLWAPETAAASNGNLADVLPVNRLRSCDPAVGRRTPASFDTTIGCCTHHRIKLRNPTVDGLSTSGTAVSSAGCVTASSTVPSSSAASNKISLQPLAVYPAHGNEPTQRLAFVRVSENSGPSSALANSSANTVRSTRCGGGNSERQQQTSSTDRRECCR